MPKWLRFFKELYKRSLVQDDIFDLSAQLAYYFLMSIFPFLIFVMTLLAYLPISSTGVVDMIMQFAPKEATTLIVKNVEGILGHQRGGLLSIGIIMALFSTSSGIHATMRVLNRAYGVEESRNYLVVKAMTFAYAAGMIVVILIALILPVFGKVIGTFVVSHFHLHRDLLHTWDSVRYSVSFIVMFLLFTILYWLAPNIRLHLTAVFPGAIFATIGWQAVSLGFAYFVNNFNDFSYTYGSLGAIIALMLWFYLSAMTLILGGQINAILQMLKSSP